MAEVDTWQKQILHIIAYGDEHAERLATAFDAIDTDLKSNTIVWVTVSHGNDDFIKESFNDASQFIRFDCQYPFVRLFSEREQNNPVITLDEAPEDTKIPDALCKDPLMKLRMQGCRAPLAMQAL